MKKIMFACLLAVPLTSIAVIANTTDVIKSRNDQLAELVKDSFYSDVSRLNLTPDQYTTIVRKIRTTNDGLTTEIKEVLDDDQKDTFETIMEEKKASMGDKIGF
jgi:RNA processing factor Prp31